MKKFLCKTIVLIGAIFIGHVSLSAQDVDMLLYVRDVNGVEIGETLSRVQVRAAFGAYDNYRIKENQCSGISETFDYGEGRIHLTDRVFDDFYLCTPRHVAFTKQIKGGLRVGDSLSKLDDFKYGKPVYIEEGVYHLFEASDNPVTLFVSSGVIVGILYTVRY